MVVECLAMARRLEAWCPNKLVPDTQLSLVVVDKLLLPNPMAHFGHGGACQMELDRRRQNQFQFLDFFGISEG